ncbi:MAG: hypothetical protein F9K32_14790 [Desulfobulbaceae bacterium]|nr:MAG: hypothetical protein F9K32_14790 [Desulfobulbaceae bacterium]
MTGNEIVDGNINNLFPDISRLDRVYGRVSLRKAFVAVQTGDTEVYSGAHVVLSKPAADPNVSVCMFTTGDPHDERVEARNRLESYVTVGPRYRGWLWGDQPAGSRQILIFQVKGSGIPDVGDVLVLYNNRGLGNEEKQYVRITKAELSSAEFNATSESSEYGETAMAFQRDILKLEIGDPLRYTFVGLEISKNDSLPTNVYTTTVSDAAKYYGVMQPTAPINQGDIEINVDSIFTHLVPSAQGESPMVDLSVGEAGPVVGSGQSYSFTVASLAVANGVQVHFGRGIKPGTLTITTSNGKTYTDDSNGILMEGTTQVGTVEYATGTITFVAITGYTANLTVSAIIGVEVRRVPNTHYQQVVLANRGYNYTMILEPLPIPGSVWVDYLSQGKWYRLRDNGKGTLIPDIANTGTGTVSYTTGSLILTCGALPDAETAIIYNWANPIETVDLSGSVSVDVAEISHTLANAPVDPGSLVITWPTGVSSTATATDNGEGVITGWATGWINYSTGELAFKPTSLITAEGQYEIDYEKYPVISGGHDGSWTNTGGIVTFTLPSGPIKARSVNIDLVVRFGAYPHVYRLKDDGSGNLSSPGWKIEVPVSHPTWPGYSEAGGITGTIDYINRTVSINIASVTGIEKWREPYLKKQYTPNGSSIVNISWVTQYYDQEERNIEWADGIIDDLYYNYALSAAAQETANELIASQPFILDLTPNMAGQTIVPGSVNFSWSGNRYVDRLGKLYRNPAPTTGLGAEAGSIDYSTGIVTLSLYDGGSNTIALHSLLGRIGNQLVSSCVFRTPGAPLRPGSITIIGTTIDGLTINGSSDFDGLITGANVRGTVNYEKGIVWLEFGSMVPDSAEYLDQEWYDPDDVVDGQIFKPTSAFSDTLSYACVAYSYIPLDADLIGLDPVRLPSDGRVPIVKVGDVVVVHNTDNDTLPNPLSAGQVITLSRPNISSVELYDSSESALRVPSTKYDWDKDLQKLTMADPLDLTGFVYPIVCMHKVEDMALVSGVQINGQIIVNTGLQNAYPVAGTYVSTALLFGDLQARAYGLFDQKTWTNVWSDDLIGDATAASYNEINYPILVTNDGAVRERWALVFTGVDSFNIIGEKYGIVGTGYTTNDCSPINPSTGEPFFFLDYRGWGAGWAVNNVVRFNTEGANHDLWIARTTLQGPATEPNDQFTLQIRGDAE